jgi:DNA-binding transcriptional ArsR family regulator
MSAPAVPAALSWEKIARASAHELQIALLERLAGSAEPMSPSELAELVDAPLGVVSYHVRMLRDRGLVELARTEPRRGALQHFYRLAPGVAS